jgi:hypothetical protein
MGTQLQIIQAVMDIVGAVSGIREAPDYPPEQLSDFPFAVCFPGEGTHSFSVPGERLFLGNVILEVHVSRVDLPVAVQNSIGFGDTIPNALMKFTVTTGSLPLNGACDTFENVTQTFGELGWGDTQTLGYRFTITNIKARTTLTA